MKSGDDTGDLGTGDWRLNWKLSGCKGQMKVETLRLGIADGSGDVESVNDYRDLGATKWIPSCKVSSVVSISPLPSLHFRL